MYDFGEGIIKFMIALAILAFSVGALAMWGIPKLWEIVKPLIHAWTA